MGVKRRKQILSAIALLVAIGIYWQQSQLDTSAPANSAEQPRETQPERTERKAPPQYPRSPAKEARTALASFSEAFAERKSERWMTVSVRVIKTLPDDNKGSRHQRFLVEGRDGTTVLVAHNIDLAKHVPLRIDETIEIRGRYEWNEKGGVLHWTHADPSGRLDGGWIRHQGIEYR
tara:strand:+ start:76544 stop:77071 length:528 start_codon:yes stop_codon:yes gene_type:complete